jgi:NitT/TauT family transport system ATP-binding protein
VISEADRSTSSGSKIVFSGVSKTFVSRGKEVCAISAVDLAVRAGEFVALVGPSGCGKSTLLNLTAGFIKPSRGETIYDGAPIDGLNRKTGYMTQKDTLLPWRTAAANVQISLELRCRSAPRSEVRDRVRQMMELTGLTGFENHYPGELSGGMRKRVALARTLIYEPETLLMDEPFGALDAQLKLVMLHELQKLTQLRRMTVLFVTHDLGEAIALADRIVVFSARPGRIRAISDVPLQRPRDIFKIRFAEDYVRLHERLWGVLEGEFARGADV